MNQNGGIHKGGFAVLCHRNGGSESPGILNLSARQLAIALDYSPVYICDIEKGRKPVPDEILEQLPRLLLLDEAETNEMYDLAAKSRNTISADLPDYIMKKDIVRAALRTAKKHNVTDKQWEDFIRRITKDKE